MSSDRQGYSTNLASEFYVLSMLYRLKLAASLTLGNKKGVDIVVACSRGRAFTVEVKAVAGKNDWLVGSLGLEARDHHFVTLVSFEGAFEQLEQQPKVWNFRHDDLAPFIRSSKTGSARYISRREVVNTCEPNCGDWKLLSDAAE